VNYNSPRHFKKSARKEEIVKMPPVVFEVVKIVLIIGLILGVLGTLILMPVQEAKLSKAISVGNFYEAQSGYPAEVFVIDHGVTTGGHRYIIGDLFITLPKGSSEPRITRSLPYDINDLPCNFSIDYTSADKTRQTLTWDKCVTIDNLDVSPHEIEVK
jgi:hypothetical protein